MGENVEFCAAYVREIKPIVVAYTITDGKHEFVMAHPVSPEIKSIRLEKSVLKDHNMLLGGVDTCNGDSGGPLWLNTNDTYMDGKPQERAYLIGVIARGKGCALGNIPGIYGRVKTVLEWIIASTNKTQIYKKKSGAMDIEIILEPARIGETREISPFWEEKLPEIRKTKEKKGKKKRRKRKRERKSKNVEGSLRRIRKNKEVKTIRRKAKGQEKKIRKEKEKERKLDDNTFCS